MTEQTTWIDVPEQEVRPGDLAVHKALDLDPRPVAAVEGEMIRLQIGGLVTEPIPAAAYTYRRALPVLDVEDVRSLAGGILEDTDPGYVYPTEWGCAYERGGAAACLVGHIFARAGLPLASLRRLDDPGLSQWPEVSGDYREDPDDGLPVHASTGRAWALDSGVRALWESGRLEAVGIKVTGDAVGWLRVAQTQQDEGRPWVDAVRIADEVTGR